MGHKTLTVSDEAYNALSKMKKECESFTETILRLRARNCEKPQR
jgi:predicted CopG family antitoxin